MRTEIQLASILAVRTWKPPLWSRMLKSQAIALNLSSGDEVIFQIDNEHDWLSALRDCVDPTNVHE
jgi:hypothetical protein